MNFNCVGRDSEGKRFMKYNHPFNTVEKIQLLQRWILVQSFAYYELNNNIATDFQYDANAMQLEELSKQHPKEFMQSRYYDYFYDFYDTDEHATSGFDLLERVRKNDNDLYRRLHMDAANALDLKRRYQLELTEGE